MFRKFDAQTVKDQIDTIAIRNYDIQYGNQKYLN